MYLSLAAALILCLPVLISSLYGQAKETPGLNEVLSDYSIQFREADKYPVQKNFRYASKEKYFHSIVAQKDETRIEIEIVRPLTNTEAADYAKAKYGIVKNLYGQQIVPYNGTLTVTTECPQAKKPKEITADVLGKQTPILTANASQRYVLGVWDEKLIKQKACFFIYYDDKNGIFYQITIFRPYASFRLAEALKIINELKKTR